MTRYIKLYFYYLRRTGLFGFLGKNILKLAVLIGLLSVLLYLIENHVIAIKDLFALMVNHVDNWVVFLIFAISESLLGLIPPDIFIVWTKELSGQIGVNAWLLIGFLGTLSYIGGMISYYLGLKITYIPKINTWLTAKYGQLFLDLKKWGGFFVVISALLPVPFSLVMVICGITKYPLKWAAYLGLFRYLRFFGYAYFLFFLV